MKKYKPKRKYTKRLDPGYKDAVYAARKRDRNRCQMPGCTARRNIECHHILKYSRYHSLRTVSSNLICLCKKHHKAVTGKESRYITLFIKIVQQNAAR